METEHNVCWEPISNFGDISNINDADFNHWSYHMRQKEYILSYKPINYQQFVQCNDKSKLTSIHRKKFVQDFHGKKYVNIWNGKAMEWKIDMICKHILIYIYETFTLRHINNQETLNLLDKHEIEINIQIEFGPEIKDKYISIINEYINKVNEIIKPMQRYHCKICKTPRIKQILNKYKLKIKNLI